jgi:glycosyltransferase involved in cell wall biosynthesis
LLYEGIERLGAQVDEFSVPQLLSHRYDIWHIHWPEHFLNVRRGWQAALRAWGIPALMDAVHALGTRIVWTGHNLRAHEGGGTKLEEMFWRRFIDRLDGFISLSNCGLELIYYQHPTLRNVPCFVIPHGHYCGEYPVRYTRAQARQVLGLHGNGPVILFFGTIRPYKNIPKLLRVFREIEDPAASLLVVGSGNNTNLETSIRGEARRDARVRLLLESIPRAHVQLYFAAADVTVLPYTAMLNSGAVMLSLSLGCPTYASAQGSLIEIQRMVGDDWLRAYSGDFDRTVLQDAIEWSRAVRPAQAPLERFGLNDISAKTLAAYYAVTHKKGTVRR